MNTSHGTETANELRLRLIGQLRSVADVLEGGCSDSYCRCKPKQGGMHTNGGCKCWNNAQYALKWAAQDLTENRHGNLDCFPETR